MEEGLAPSTPRIDSVLQYFRERCIILQCAMLKRTPLPVRIPAATACVLRYQLVRGGTSCSLLCSLCSCGWPLATVPQVPLELAAVGRLTQRAETHTYLARATLWSRWQFAHGEARPLHSGSADTHANSPNVGISIAQFLVVGDCVRALP